MKKNSLILAVLFFLMQNAVYAQQKTAVGDEVGTLDGIIKAFYDVVTVKKGDKISFGRDSLLHVPEAIVGITKKGKDGKMKLQMISLKQFHQESDVSLEKDGFFEKELSRKVEKFGSIYQVWSTYETKNSADGPLLQRGINSIQLFFDGTRFWILSWVAEDESKEQPIPKKYLKN